MDCSCQINIDIDYYHYEEISCNQTTAANNFKCCECNEIIPANDKHWVDIMKATWENPPKIDIFRTCIDCMSVRNEIFCDFQFESMWELLYDYLADDGLIPESCIVKLTPKARDTIYNAIEEVWKHFEDEDDENDDTNQS